VEEKQINGAQTLLRPIFFPARSDGVAERVSQLNRHHAGLLEIGFRANRIPQPPKIEGSVSH